MKNINRQLDSRFNLNKLDDQIYPLIGSQLWMNFRYQLWLHIKTSI